MYSPGISLDVPVRTQVLQAQLTPAEARIGQALLDDYPQSALASAQRLAKAAGTSAASVTRFVTKLGYRNFSELQDKLGNELRAQLASPSKRLRVSKTRVKRRPSELLADAIDLDIENLRKTAALIEANVFDRFVENLQTARGRIYVTGSKKAWVLATYFAIQLGQIRPRVTLLRLDDTVQDELLDVTESDMLVVFEPRRATTALVKVVRSFTDSGSMVGAVCDEFPAPDLVTLENVLCVPTHGLSIFDSYTAILTVINAALAGLIARAPRDVRSRIDRLEALNQSFGTWATLSPLR